MSEIQEIIDLTEKINHNSDALINKVIELSYGITSNAGISNLIFAFAIFSFSTFIGYLTSQIITDRGLKNKGLQENLLYISLSVAAFSIFGASKNYLMLSIISAITAASCLSMFFIGIFSNKK